MRATLLIFVMSSAAWAKTVTTTAELSDAIANAVAGDEIVLADGTYDSTGFSCNANGTQQMPITVRAQNSLQALVRFNALEGFKIAGDYWHFADLAVTGVCPNDSDCEHGFHINGAVGFQLRGSRVVDFNAQVKVNAAQNGATWKLPNNGLIESNEFFDTRARNTSNPTTKLDLDSGDDWIVRGNLIHDFEKGQGDNISYGAFLKCGGQRGLMERNLVLCARDFTGGTRIGLSLGGGGCAPQFCEPNFNANLACLEHSDGIVRNNIIVNCSDVGIYVNQSKNSRVDYNTLIATAGIDFRFAMTTGEAIGNVLAGQIRNRDGATGMFSGNLEMVTTFQDWYVDPLNGDLRKKGDLSALIGKGMSVAVVTDDYCGRTRPMPFDIGALQHSLGDCVAMSMNDLGANDLAANSADLATSSDGSVMPAKASGCSCDLSSAPISPTPISLMSMIAGMLLLLRLSRRR